MGENWSFYPVALALFMVLKQCGLRLINKKIKWTIEPMGKRIKEVFFYMFHRQEAEVFFASNQLHIM
jgi:hypothetical protein